MRQTEGFKNVEEALKNRQTVRWLKELAQIEPEKVPCCAFREEEVYLLGHSRGECCK